MALLLPGGVIIVSTADYRRYHAAPTISSRSGLGQKQTSIKALATRRDVGPSRQAQSEKNRKIKKFLALHRKAEGGNTLYKNKKDPGNQRRSPGSNKTNICR
jgi:hypothetical protein